MIEVGRGGAFTVNCVGVDRSPFPLSFTVRETGGSWQIDASAAQAGELIDVLSRSANDTVLVVDPATNSFLDEDFQQWRPSLIAAEQGTDFTAHPIGAWASDAPGPGGEILVMHRDSPPRFLDGSRYPYEPSLIDVPTAPPRPSSTRSPWPSEQPPSTSRSSPTSRARASGIAAGATSATLATIRLSALPQPWQSETGKNGTVDTELVKGGRDRR